MRASTNFFNRLESAILNKLKQCPNPTILESVYAAMIKASANQDCFLTNQFIGTCTSFRRLDLAISAFTQTREPNAFVYNALIRGFVQCCLPIQAFEFYRSMLRAQVSPSSFTFSSLVKASGDSSAYGPGESVHGHICKLGFDSHLYVQTGLIDFYSKLGKIFDSRKVFDEMLGRDVFAWTTMISACTRIGDMISATRLFYEMPQKNTATFNCMIDGYARSGNVESAELLFSQMVEKKDIITWTAMINCYSLNKRFREALAVFYEMTKNHIIPDEITLSTVISACAHLGALDLGKEIHLYAMLNAFDLDVYTGSALVDMYAKCGSLERSLLIFFKLPEKNLFCWNSIVEGLAAHGYAQEALKMFESMKRSKIRPNEVTFVSVLTACTHAGLVEEGRKVFRAMTLDHSIDPNIQHYGCIVDLLSKSGLVQEALNLILNMEFEPNAVIWGTLLGGCKIHKNLEVAELAVEKLMVLEPGNSGYYTLLVNMYAEENRWRDVADLRGKMKELGIEKTFPGSSWIEIEREVHQFAAADMSHPAVDEFYSLLNELYRQILLVEYVPQLGLYVSNSDIGKKEKFL